MRSAIRRTAEPVWPIIDADWCAPPAGGTFTVLAMPPAWLRAKVAAFPNFASGFGATHQL